MENVLSETKRVCLCGISKLLLLLLFGSSGAMAQQVLKGKVTDGKDPLIGVSITVKGTTSGSFTNGEGEYEITTSAQNPILVFSMIGYTSKELSARGGTIAEVVLEESNIGLDEVVVVGYGVQRKSDLTGSISQVKTEDIENRTVTNAQQALQGKAAGVQVIQTSGAPGSNPTIRIRGFSSNSSSDPLYVVDGLRTSNIAGIDPNNIESMEVLKDAASAAIYGAQAGNGVILITTKKGKSGVAKITYDYQVSTNELNRIPRVMNAQEYVKYMTEANFISPQEVNNLWDGVTNTNWADVAFEKAFMHRHNLGLQGGNEKGTYFVGLSYLDQDGIVSGNQDVYNRISGMINGDYKIRSWLKIGTTNTLEKWTSQSVSENSEYGSLLAAVLTMDPLTPNVYKENNLPDFMNNHLQVGRSLVRNSSGDYYGLSRIFESEQIHPGIMRDITQNKNSGANILGTMFMDITPLKGLVFTSKFGYRGAFSNNHTFQNMYYANAVAYRDKINMSRTSSNSIYYQWENFANYHFKIKAHDFTVMAGTSYQHTETASINAAGNELIKNDIPYRDLDFLAPTATRTIGGIQLYTRQLSYFGRLSYNYLDKILFQASLRRDASDNSILPYENRWGTFPAMSLGYVVSKEKFFPKTDWISFLKVRASWGQNGSTGPLGGYAYLASIMSGGMYPYSSDLNYTVASSPNTLTNPNLTWETSEQVDFGVDLRAFDNRFTATLDYFEKKTSGLLVAITPPYETGVTSTVVNAGNVSNKGFEAELGWEDQFSNGFRYGVKGNIATLKNKVTYLDPSISRISGASYHTFTGITAFEQGLPVWYFRGYELLGINRETGDPMFKDQLTVDSNGDGIPDQGDGIINDQDMAIIGSAIPDFTYGITLTGSFKGFDLTVFGAGSKGNKIYNALTRIDRPRGNKLSIFYDERWTPENMDASRPRPNANGEDKYWISDAAIFDGSFFKIKQLQLGYRLPKNVLSHLKIENCRVYTSLDDWFVFTKYPGMDPEASAGSTSALGVDKGAYPIAKKLVFGINLSF
jgi:TonB-linked SusC/RagA family outer membrane protein